MYFLTKRSQAVKQKTTVGEDRSQNVAFGPVLANNSPLYESIGHGLHTCTGEDLELQPSPAYQEVPDDMSDLEYL